jgi:hypothetical protein
MKQLLAGLMGLSFVSGLLGCSPADPSWKKRYPNLTAYSSVRTADLNRDGTDDLIFGTGSAEWVRTDTGFVALDGKTGELLWRLPARNQIVGTAVLDDVTGDGVPDVFLGGRSAELKAIDGASGRLLWEFFRTNEIDGPKKAGWFNFTTPQLITDQNGDGFRDLLIANGGDASLKPRDPNRPTGLLLIISSRDGRVLAKAPVPDGHETYLTPVLSDLGQPTDNPTIFFGTGGETLPGGFYRTTLADLRRGDLSKAIRLAESISSKGFIASPVLTDLTGDGVLDVVVNAVEGIMRAFDGRTNALLWDNRFVGTECYVSPTPGYFNDDDVPDFFMAHSVGVWPNFEKLMDVGFLDGKTGRLLANHEYLNCSFTFAAPLSVDVNGDGFTEIVLPTNQQSTALEKRPGDQFRTKILFYDFHHQTKRFLTDSLQGINWASTPYIGDLDRDGTTDLVYLAEATDRYNDPETVTYQRPLGLNIARRSVLDFPPSAIYWGSYLGSQYDSVFRKKRQKP